MRVVVVLAVMGFVAGCSSTPVDTVPTTETRTTLITTTVVSGGETGSGTAIWSGVDLGSEFYGGQPFSFPESMAASSEAVVMSGQAGERMVLWVTTDTDAQKWMLLPDALGPGDVQVESITPYGDGFVGVGIASDKSAAVWASPDVTSWQRIEQRTFSGDDAASTGMFGVATNGSVLVGVGRWFDADEYRAGVWSSADGLQWSLIEQDAIGGDDSEADQQMEGVAWTGSLFVAYGWESTNQQAFDPAIWTSATGEQWERSQIQNSVSIGQPGEYGIKGVVTIGEDLLAVANTPNGPALLASTTGAAWTMSPMTDSQFDNVAISGVAATADTVNIFGTRDLGDGARASVSFSSPDAMAWSEESSTDGTFANSAGRLIVWFGDKLIAAGYESSPSSDGQVLIWTAR